MAAVDPLFAQWLQGTPLWAPRTNAALAQRWGDSAITGERQTGIATYGAAVEEAERQLAFFARGPFATDVHQIPGDDWHREVGRVVRLTIDQIGYSGGADVFVLGAEVDRASGMSEVTVLVPLGPAA